MSPKLEGWKAAGGGVGSSDGALTVRRITKRFGNTVAVDNVTIDLAAGSFLSLLGPSGCGKTTLLRIIAGLEEPDDGSVAIDGRDITRHAPERRPLNMVFQRYALFPHLSVFDNVSFGLTTDRSNRPPRQEIERRVNEMLELVGLTSFGQRRPGQLSGGEQQRVAVARALIRRPRVLLLDEPMSALDRNVRHQVREELLRIHNELGTTFVLVTHDQDEALSISGLVGLMNEGRLEQLAEPQALYRRPATLFAARFVGAGAFLYGKVIGLDGTAAQVDVDGLRFSAANSGLAVGGRAAILLRPEEVLLCPEDEGRIRGVIETSAYYGSYFEITVRSPIGLMRLRGSEAAVPGTVVGLDWPHAAGIAYPNDA